jgi:adenylate cyclase
MRFLSRFLHSIGVFAIVATSLSAIFITVFVKELHDENPWKKPFEYILSFENRFYDYRIKTTFIDTPANDSAILVTIDDESLQKINSWPIPRENWAKLLDNLNKFGANVVAFDVLYPEPVKSCEETSPDDLFAAAIERFNNTQAYETPEQLANRTKDAQEDEDTEKLKTVILSYSIQAIDDDFIDETIMKEPPFDVYTSMISNTISPNCKAFQRSGIESHTFPIQKYLDSGPDLAYLNMEEDSDGVFRHYSLFKYVPSVENEGPIILPSLGTKAFLAATDISNLKVKIHDQCFATFNIGGKVLKTNSHADTKIRWIGERKKFKSISLYRVLEGEDFEYEKRTEIDGAYVSKKDPDFKDYKLKPGEYWSKDNVAVSKIKVDMSTFFKGKTIFVGSTSTGAHDLRNTAINPTLPGVYSHMNFYNMLEHQFFFKNTDDSIFHSLYILSAGMLILLLVMMLAKPVLDIFILAFIIIASYSLDHYFYIPNGYELSLFYCYFAFGSTYSWVTFLNFNKSNAEKKQIKGAFSRYVAPSIVDDMLDNPDKLKVGGEKRDITCMFSDVRDFTSISEALSPSELAMALNRYMGEMTDIVFETNGTLDKYIGDAIVAFWGAPIDIGDHVNQSINAGVKMLEALPAINEEFKQKGFPEFKIGLGLNSGECSVGNMGSDQIFAYTALGDNMNLGARLESLCKYYGAQILVSEYTYNRMDQERWTSRLIDNAVVKGKTEPVGVYEILYSYHAFMIDQESLANFKTAFQLFTDGKFQEALNIFEKLAELHPEDKASNRMKETCEHWIENPPKEGEDYRITTMTTKG